MARVVRRTSTALPQRPTRSRPSAISRPMNPSAARMNAGQLIGSGRIVAGTVASASSGSPASAARRSRAASRSTAIAISATPPAVSSVMPSVSGTGAAKR